MQIKLSNQQNENYEETKQEFFLEGKDPLQVLWDTVEGDQRDNKNEDSNLEQEQ